METRVGALIIGQSPRPDLVDPLRALLPAVDIVEAGALDGLSVTELPDPAGASYPLTTRMRDGTLVTVPESYLIPRLQLKIEALAADGIQKMILLCAGTFGRLHSQHTLIKPFRTTLAVAQSLGLARLGLIVPIPGQAQPVEARWQQAGFTTSVWTADLWQQDEQFDELCRQQIAANGLEAIVLDYVGYPAGAVAKLRQTATIPVLDLGDIAIRTLASMF